MVLQVLAVPVMPFTDWNLYSPSWQEVATTILPVAYGIILIMMSYRYLPIFPQEQELNPLEPQTSPEKAAVSEAQDSSTDTPAAEPEPAQA
jgi:molybdopterin-containing oxidoreductase family membrane subunit